MDLSFCLIGKNESSHLRRCLFALKKCGQEIVFVDTGSTDDTVEIAKEFTDRIFFFKWINDFSAARNYAMEQASNDMVLFIDCDEYLEDDSSPLDALTLMEKYPDALGQILRRNVCDDGRGGQTIYEDRVERLFDRRLFRYSGRIHEQPVRRDGTVPSAYHLPLSFCHDGYLGTPEQKHNKGKRDLDLLLEELAENRKNDLPDDPYIFYQLGQACTLMSDKDKALEYYSYGLSLPVDPSLTYVQMMITNYGNTLSDAGRYDEALSLASHEDSLIDYADFFTMLGYAALQTKKYLTSIYYYKKALSAPRHNLNSAADALPHHNLGCIYEAFGNRRDAYEHFIAADKAGHAGSADRAEALSAMADTTVTFHNFIFMCDKDTEPTKLISSFDSLRSQTVGFEHLIASFICPKEMDNDPVYKQIRAWEAGSPENILILESDETGRNSSVIEIMNVVKQYSQAPLLTLLTPGDVLHTDHVRLMKSFYELLKDHSPAILRCGSVSKKRELYLEASEEKEPQAWQITEAEFLRIINNDPSGCTFSAGVLSEDKHNGYVLADTGLRLFMAD